MKISEDENIDKLFKGLNDHSIEPDMSQIEDMKIRLEGMRYYSFGWKHFNIYHTGVIGISIVLSLYTFTDRIIYGKEDTHKKAVSTENLEVRDTIFNASKINEEAYRNKNSDAGKFKAAPLANAPIASRDSKQDSLIVPSSDNPDKQEEISANSTLSIVENKDSISLPKSVLPKQKKIIYISKKDTVYKYDTTKVVRKK